MVQHDEFLNFKKNIVEALEIICRVVTTELRRDDEKQLKRLIKIIAS